MPFLSPWSCCGHRLWAGTASACHTVTLRNVLREWGRGWLLFRALPGDRKPPEGLHAALEVTVGMAGVEEEQKKDK